MSEHELTPRPPAPSVETLNMLRELGNYLVAQQPMSAETNRLLQASIADQPNQHRLFLAAVAAHKMQRFPRLLRAIDFMREKLMDPAILAAICADPEDARKHLQVLLDMEKNDLAFLSQGAGTQAPKHGRSDDPEREFEMFFAGEIRKQEAGGVVPPSVSDAGRRTIQSAVQMFFSLASRGGSAPRPPRTEERDTRAAIVDRVLKGDVGDVRGYEPPPHPGAGSALGSNGGGRRS